MNINELKKQNTKLNNHNFNLSKKIDKLKAKLYGLENVKKVWEIKDRIRAIHHKILLNSQQVQFNLLTMTHLRTKGNKQ